MQKSKVIEHNKDFYKNISKQFSDTRKYSWKGWEEVFSEIEIKNNDSILDVACGNGRFVSFLQKRYDVEFSYLGLDFDENLLNVAKNNFSNDSIDGIGGIDGIDGIDGIATNNFSSENGIKFNRLDVINNINTISKKFDLVVAFGITHHIPDNEFRLNWFIDISKLVKKGGYLIFSNWNFLDKKSTTPANELQENDYWVGWGSTKEKRYCHYYDKKEMDTIIDLLSENGLKIIKEIKNKDDLNEYYVFKRKN